jgi:hypothetical protein
MKTATAALKVAKFEKTGSAKESTAVDVNPTNDPEEDDNSDESDTLLKPGDSADPVGPGVVGPGVAGPPTAGTHPDLT